MKRRHEGLHGYLKQITSPGEISSTTPNPRLPVGPDSKVPTGFNPIPTSSQRPKGTNATIVYARTATTDLISNSPLTGCVSEGDVVLTERMQTNSSGSVTLYAPTGKNVKVVSVKQANDYLASKSAMTDSEANGYLNDSNGEFRWFPDGVVNNVDGADPYNEYKDFAIANVAVQGFCRFSTLGLSNKKGLRNGDHVYLALVATRPTSTNPDLKNYQFKFIPASEIMTNEDATKGVEKAWSIGRVVDGNQSKNMITLCVGVGQVLHPDPKTALEVSGGPVVMEQVAETLKRLWKGKNKK